MDLHALNAYLTKIRAAKSAELKPCGLVSDRFIRSPPHAVGVAHLILRPRMLLGDPTGTGKTPQTLVAYGYLKEKSAKLKMLVLTTQTAQFQWARAVEKFLVGVSAAVLSYQQDEYGRYKQLGPQGRAQQWPALMGTDVWITTPALMTKEVTNLLQALDEFVLVFDEIQTFKSHVGEVQYPAAQKLTQKARCVWGLSATPMMNDKLGELYSVMELIRPGTFGEFSRFRKTYYVLQLVKPKWKNAKVRAFYKTLGYQNLAHLQSQVEPFFLKRPIGEFQQYLPPVTFQQLDIPLDPKQRAIYEEIKSKHWPVSRTPLQQLAALTYCQMAVDAPAVLGFPSVPSAKTTELVRLLTEALSDQQVIVYCKYLKVVEFLSATLAKAEVPHGIIAGPLTAPQRLQVQDAFQAGQIPVVLVTSAGAQAIDLQAASTVICYDLPWSWGEFQQIIGRARRTGSTHANVNVVLLCGDQTIDVAVALRLTKKEAVIGRVVGTDSTSQLAGRAVVRADASEVIADTDTVEVPEEDVDELFRVAG